MSRRPPVRSRRAVSRLRARRGGMNSVQQTNRSRSHIYDLADLSAAASSRKASHPAAARAGRHLTARRPPRPSVRISGRMRTARHRAESTAKPGTASSRACGAAFRRRCAARRRAFLPAEAACSRPRLPGARAVFVLQLLLGTAAPHFANTRSRSPHRRIRRGDRRPPCVVMQGVFRPAADRRRRTARPGTPLAGLHNALFDARAARMDDIETAACRYFARQRGFERNVRNTLDPAILTVKGVFFMVKGISRRVVVVRPESGGPFEQAIFLVRDPAFPRGDAVREACRIAEGLPRLDGGADRGRVVTPVCSLRRLRARRSHREPRAPASPRSSETNGGRRKCPV